MFMFNHLGDNDINHRLITIPFHDVGVIFYICLNLFLKLSFYMLKMHQVTHE